MHFKCSFPAKHRPTCMLIVALALQSLCASLQACSHAFKATGGSDFTTETMLYSS